MGLEEGVPYSSIPFLPPVTVPGHPGLLLQDDWDGVRVALMAGRFHLYEGLLPREAAMTAILAKLLGAKKLIQFAAVGQVHPAMPPGTLVGINDHINLTGRSPLEKVSVRGGNPFVPGAFHSEVGRLAGRVAAKNKGVLWREGVYAQMPGPQLETASEVEMVRRLGGDIVGMSTVPEAIAAAYLGLEHLGMGAVTNIAPMPPGSDSHKDVLRVAERIQEQVPKFLHSLVKIWS